MRTAELTCPALSLADETNEPTGIAVGLQALLLHRHHLLRRGPGLSEC